MLFHNRTRLNSNIRVHILFIVLFHISGRVLLQPKHTFSFRLIYDIRMLDVCIHIHITIHLRWQQTSLFMVLCV